MQIFGWAGLRGETDSLGQFFGLGIGDGRRMKDNRSPAPREKFIELLVAPDVPVVVPKIKYQDARVFELSDSRPFPCSLDVHPGILLQESGPFFLPVRIIVLRGSMVLFARDQNDFQVFGGGR